MKISDYIFSFLKEKGVGEVFMLPGGGAMHLVDSLGRSGIPYVCCQHEQAAAIAAESYGQHTNHLGVVLVTSGPGGTNAVTGVTAGWIDSTPMLIISGQAKREDLVGDKGVRQIGSQEVAIIDMVKPVTKYAAQVKEPENIRFYLEKAYYEATHGRKGPAWLDIPLDVQAVLIEPDRLKRFEPPKIDDSGLEAEAEAAAKELRRAKKPLLLVGNGVYASGGRDQLYELLERLRIPTQTTWKAMDLIWEDHPLYVGHPGTLGERGSNYILQECDLLVALGARLDNSITAFNEKEFAPGAYKIVVDIDDCELRKFQMEVQQKVCGDVKRFMELLNQKLEEEPAWAPKDWLEHCRALRRKYPVITKRHESAADYVSGYYFTGVLSDMLSEGDVIVPESAGVTAEATFQAFRIKKGQKMKNAAGLGSMGFGLPYSIGACLANHRQRTVLINGDGAFQLNIQELETLHRLNLPVLIFIWNNDGYASIRAMQKGRFAQNYVGCDARSGLTLPDIRRVAEAYGIRTRRICTNAEVRGALEELLAGEGPVLCELMISPDEAVAPKVVARMRENGQMIAGTLDHMWPFTEEE